MMIVTQSGDQIQEIRVEKTLDGNRDGESPNSNKDVPSPALIQSFPTEILAEIFQVGVSMLKDQFQSLPFQHAISSVDRHWREVAISTPRLWNTITFCCGTFHEYRGLHRLSLWIERSAPCVLDITLTVQPELFSRSLIQSAINHIIPHTGRWNRLTIKDLPGSEVEFTIKSLHTSSAPRLQHFDLSVIQNYGSYTLNHDRIFTGGAPNLVSARIVGLCKICPPPLAGLTALHFGGACRASGSIRMTHGEFRDMLTASPSLTNLALEAVDLWSSSKSHASAINIHIPSLRALSLNFSSCEDSFVQILTLLSMPILETLSLARMTRKHMITLETFSKTSPPHYPTLQTLKLFMCSTLQEVSDEPPESFFSAFSSITHLFLISTADFILEHTSHDQAIGMHWPSLRAVTISPKVFPDTIQSRISRRHPITRAYIPDNSLSSDEDLWAYVREEIEVLEVDDADSLQYPGGLDQNEEDNQEGEDEDEYDSEMSELLEYWAAGGSDY